MKKRVLFICGSINQTKQMHQVAMQMPDIEPHFTPYYCDGILELLRRARLLGGTIMGEAHVKRCLSYLRYYDLDVDYRGQRGPYDLVLTCSDLVVPRNIRRTPMVLVQEGMTDPENILYHIVRRLKFLPRWIASTSTTGLSGLFDRFCVASEGYRELFVRKGVDPDKIAVTGIPNFDNCSRFLKNDFPHRNYVLVCTSDMRETLKFENRKAFIRRAVRIGAGRPMIFKLHPNEKFERAEREIRRHAPGALIYRTGNTDEMIANCDVLITRYSTTVYVGLALGKECYSDFDIESLRRMVPVQNRSAARNIADVCVDLLEYPPARVAAEAWIDTEQPNATRRRSMYRAIMAGLFPGLGV
ncbi:MAG TPA: hypothetical protein VL126_14330 [Bacteroidota bacterium]|nr:hypothetical protein [Bacteroidota bacterium]